MGDVEVGNSIRLDAKFDQLERGINSVVQSIERLEGQTKKLNETSEQTKKATEGLFDLEKMKLVQSVMDSIIGKYTGYVKQLMDLAIAGDKKVELAQHFQDVWKGSAQGLAQAVSELTNYRMGVTQAQQLLIRMSALGMDQYQAMKLVESTSKIAVGLGIEQATAQEAVLRAMETGATRSLNALHITKEQKEEVTSTAALYELIVKESSKYAELQDTAGKSAAEAQLKLAAVEGSVAKAATESERLKYSFEGISSAAELVSKHSGEIVSFFSAADFSGIMTVLLGTTELIGRVKEMRGGPGVGAGITDTSGMNTQEFLKYQMSLIPGGGAGSSAGLNSGGFGAGQAAGMPGVVDFSEEDAYADLIQGNLLKPKAGAKPRQTTLGDDLAAAKFGGALSGAMGNLEGYGTNPLAMFAGLNTDPFATMGDSAARLAETLESQLAPALQGIIDRQNDAEQVGKDLKKTYLDIGASAAGGLAQGLLAAARGQQSIGEAMLGTVTSISESIMAMAVPKAIFETAEGFAAQGLTMGIPNPASIAHFTSAGIFAGLAAGGFLGAVGGSLAQGALSGGSSSSSGGSSGGTASSTASFIEPSKRTSDNWGQAPTVQNNYYIEGHAIGDLSSFGVLTDQAQRQARSQGRI